VAERVTRIIVNDHEPRLLIGTTAGRVVACAIHQALVVAFNGLEGDAIHALCASEDGRLVMAADAQGRVAVWDRATQTLLDTFHSPQPVVQGSTLGAHHYLTLDNRRRGTIWARHAEGHMVPVPFCDEQVEPCPFDQFGVSDEGARVVLRSAFQWSVWDLHTRTVTETHKPVDGLRLDYMSGDIGLSPNGQFYYTYWDDYLVIDTVSGAVVRELPVIMDPMTSALSNDGRILVVGGRSGEVAGVASDGAVLFKEKLAEGPVQHVSLNANGRLATFVDDTGVAGCLNVEAGRLVLDQARIRTVLAI